MDSKDGQDAAVAAAVSPSAQHDPLAALRYRDFRLLAAGRFVASLGEQMLGVAVGWELYERTGSELALGLVGLVQVLPVITLSMVAGHVADRFNRRIIVLTSQMMLASCSLGLALLSLKQGSLALVYLCLLLIGVARAFNTPATSTLLPQTVPPEVFTNAATWSSSAWQFAAVCGPAFGGLMIAAFGRAAPVYLVDAVTAIIFVGLVWRIRGRQIALSRERTSMKALMGGFRFIWNTKVILAAVTLDMFAVLLGGATALLPVYAKDILHAGSEGLGWMRAAPSVGALVMVIALAYLPPFRHAGKTLLLAVIGFGVATIIFGFSRSFPLSMLMLMGAFDNISVVIRSTLLLTRTPDELRGRAAAVNNIFIGASNELGGFESGVAAELLRSPVAAVVMGGLGTILVVGAVAQIWPEIRRLGKL